MWRYHSLKAAARRAINPRTGETYTDEDYRDDMATLVRRIQNAMSQNKLYIGNGVGHLQGDNSLGFWNMQTLVEPLIDEEDGVMIEGFIRWNEENWRTESSWIKDVNTLAYLSAKNLYTLS
jgi:hypothetical protein